MANSAEQDPEAKHKYEDVEVFKVDIVGGPATKDKFIVVRSEDEDEAPKPRRRAMTKAAVTALRQNGEGAASLPVVARQEVVDGINEIQPVERTEENEPENNSEETMTAKEMNEKINQLTGRIERMEKAAEAGDFSEVLGTAPATPEGEEDPEANPAPEGETVPAQPVEAVAPEAAPVPSPIPEPEATPAPVPVVAPVEPEAVASAPAPVPVVAAPVAPVPAAPAPEMVPAQSITDAVGNLTDQVQRMATAFQTGLATVNTKIDGMAGRVNKVERSVLSEGNAEEGDGTEGPIERADEGDKPGLFHNIFS